MFSYKVAALIFLAYVVIDALYAMYTIKVTQRRAFSAATMGAIMYGLLAFGAINYVSNPWYVVPVALGSFLGTYVVVKLNK